MCGRITLRRPDRVKLPGLDTRALLDEVPRHNIAPTQSIWVVTETNEERSVSLKQWGLIPAWSKKPTGFINARAETLETRPSFKEAFMSRRCLIPADGFYEWEKLGKAKQPHYFQMQSAAPFFLAGIWDEWQLNGTSMKTCAIITTTANSLLSTIHNRMPVILPGEAIDGWLSSNAKSAELWKLLKPFPDSEMQGFPVSLEVNRSEADHAGLVARLPPGELVRDGMLF